MKVSEFPTACQCHNILWVDLRLESPQLRKVAPIPLRGLAGLQTVQHRIVLWQWIESNYENLHQELCRSIGRRSRREGIHLTVLVGMRSNASCASKDRRRNAGVIAGPYYNVTVCVVMIPPLGVSSVPQYLLQIW
jgi:hypothetical protein